MTLFDKRYSRIYDMDYSEGLNLLKELKKALPNAYISVKILDIYPGLDSEDLIEKTVKTLKLLKPNSVSYNIRRSLTLKQTQNYIDAFMDDETFTKSLDDIYNLKLDEDGSIENAFILDQTQQDILHERIHEQLNIHNLAYLTSRFLPLDYRYSNYEVAERLFLRAFQCVDSSEKEEIIEVAQSIQSLKYAVNRDELLAYCKSAKVKRDIDYYLSTHELKSYGQRGLF
jgi:hypothetical protein